MCIPPWRRLYLLGTDEEVFIIGGGALFAATLPMAHRLYLTTVQARFPEADTHFPTIDFAQWEAVQSTDYPADERNDYHVTLTVYNRINR